MDEEAGELSEVRVRSSVLADTPGVRGPGGGAGGGRGGAGPHRPASPQGGAAALSGSAVPRA